MKIPDWLWRWQDEHGWVIVQSYTDHLTGEVFPIERRPAKWNLYAQWLARQPRQLEQEETE